MSFLYYTNIFMTLLVFLLILNTRNVFELIKHPKNKYPKKKLKQRKRKEQFGIQILPKKFRL